MNRIFAVSIIALSMIFGACAEREVEETADVVTPIGTETTATTTVDVDTVWGDYGTWDVDRNNQLVADEFGTRFNDVYAGWGGADRTLTRDEMADTWYDWWDFNDDNIIDENEWRTGTTNWNVENVTWGDYGTWDADSNGITDVEFRAGFGRAWPANATWSVDEMRDTWWDFFDGNDDNIVDGDEWRTRAGYWDNV